MTALSYLTDDRRMAYRRRLKVPVVYRLRRTSASERISAVENVSELGVYFGTDQEVVIGTPIELLMEMPKAITRASQWYGRGRVVRIDPLDTLNGLRGVAVQLYCYEILPSRTFSNWWSLSKTSNLQSHCCDSLSNSTQ
jgi:hypothetical protein